MAAISGFDPNGTEDQAGILATPVKIRKEPADRKLLPAGFVQGARKPAPIVDWLNRETKRSLHRQSLGQWKQIATEQKIVAK